MCWILRIEEKIALPKEEICYYFQCAWRGTSNQELWRNLVNAVSQKENDNSPENKHKVTDSNW